ncbi:MAG: hypothetical protein AAFQ02_12785 [Bacteroidota bacterium]
MTTYTIPTKQRTILLGGMVVGLVCLALSWFLDHGDYHMRFWTNFLHNSVFFTGISFMAVMFYAICHTAWAGWHTQFKRVWEAMGAFLGVGLVLMGIIALGLLFNVHHLYHWADPNSVATDEILQHKSSFLNKGWFIISIGVIALWYFFAMKFRAKSQEEDANPDGSYKIHMRMRFWTAAFLPVAGFSSCLVFWQWVMSIDAHWYSTLFAWYSGASLFVSMIAVTILVLIFLKNNGYYPNVSLEHFHDLGKFLFAFSIFWTYLWFSQYMLIWYSNVGEETVYFNTRQDKYPVLFYANLAINFLIPFFVLMRNDTKRKFGSLMVVSIAVLFGHWLDFFLMIKPGAAHTAHELGAHHDHGTEAAHGADHGVHGGGALAETAADHAHGAADAMHAGGHHAASTFEAGFTLPGLIELGTSIGFFCLFLYVFYTYLSKANLVAKNDPYLSESLHHHV